MQPDFWTANADTMELTLEGNRLIAREVAELARALWHRVAHTFDASIHGTGKHRDLPRV